MVFARRALVFFCWAYLVLLPVQFLLAGMGIMGGDLDVHMMFGGMILHVVLPVLMLISALVARMWHHAGWAVLLFVILTLQIMMVELGGNMDSDLVQGAHPFIAFLTWPYVYFVMLRTAAAGVDVTPAPTTAP